ncbi:hypothetical protein IWQ62_003391 [Dispira parvispora]|uniref:BZIP domain-containing protein n=1 Tax=Dispira parvispora TaxID=1520584 RepID=A0A9W8AUW8_9FUNG|nr:hypothetical protein IWQ62_003391 [Dispira parvispora]
MSNYKSFEDYLLALNPDSPDNTPPITAQEFQDELALWAGAQFESGQNSSLGLVSPSFLFGNGSQLVPGNGQSTTSSTLPNFSQGSVDYSLPLGNSSSSPTGASLLTHTTIPTTSATHTGDGGATVPGDTTSSTAASTYNALLNLLASQPTTPVTPAPPGVLSAGLAAAVPTLSSHSHPQAAALLQASGFPYSTILPTRNTVKSEVTHPSRRLSGGVTKTTTAIPTFTSPSPSKRKASSSASSSTSTQSMGLSDALSTTDTAPPSEATLDSNTQFQLAGEEDKRRRNTAASARFRAKKKLREQAMERTAKEMTAKAEALEQRVKELETEIKWLRGLVIEKDPNLLNASYKCAHQGSSVSTGSALGPDGTNMGYIGGQPAIQPATKRPKIMPSSN